jgi:hypothetical protein
MGGFFCFFVFFAAVDFVVWSMMIVDFDLVLLKADIQSFT